MNLAQFAIRRPVTTLMLIVSVVVLGVIALSRLPLLFIPTFDAPILVVVVPYPSSAPDETARLIVEPIEEAMGTVSHLQRLTSEANASEGRVRLEFHPDADMELAAVEVRDRLDRVRWQLPDDVQHVFLRRRSTTDIPIMALQVSGQVPQDVLADMVDHTIQRRLQALEGVADVQVFGLQEKRIQVHLHPERLEAHGLTTYQLAMALRRNHLAMSGGSLTDGNVRYLLRTVGEFNTPQQIADLPLNAQGLRLRDVAEVRYTYPEKTRYDHLDKIDAVTIAIYRTSTANVVDVARSVHETLDTIQQLPGMEKLSLFVYFDSSHDILKRLDHLKRTGLLGGALALVVLLLFLRNLRVTFVLGLAIPICVMATFLIMYLMRETFGSTITLNLVSLSGLMLSVGMLVDNSVVVLENIVRHRQLGKPSADASVTGTQEVSHAVLVATATSIVVFLPIVFVSTGWAGRIMSEFGLVLCAALVASLAVSLSGIPLLSARLLSSSPPLSNRHRNRFSELYGKAINWTLHRRGLVVFIAVVVFSASLYSFITTLLPNRDLLRSARRQMFITVKTARTISFSQVKTFMEQVEDQLLQQRDQLEIRHVATSFSDKGNHRLRVFFREVEESDSTLEVLQERLLEALPKPPGVEYRTRRGVGPSGIQPGIAVNIQGPNGEVLANLARLVKTELRDIPGVYNVDTDVDRDDAELQLEIDRQQAHRLNLHPRRVAATVAFAMSERPITTMTLDDEEVDILFQVGTEGQLSTRQLASLPVASRNRDRKANVSHLANSRVQPAPTAVKLEDRIRTTRVIAYTQDRLSLSEVAREIAILMGKLSFPTGYSWKLGSSYRRFAQSGQDASFTLFLAVVLIYLIMAALFESLIMPFAIMLTVPFALSGVVALFTLTGTNLNQIADLGMLILCGLVVNSGIMLIDTTNQLRARGLSRSEALIQSGQQRLRPIMMTVITTVAGLGPMVAPLLFPAIFGPPERYVAFYGPIGLVVVGGLCSSTLLTLLLLPPVYSLLDEASVVMRQARARLRR